MTLKSKRIDDFREIADNFSCGMTLFTITKEGTYHIDYLSDELASIYETDAQILRDALESDIVYKVHPEDCDMVSDYIKTAISSHKVENFIYRIISTSGILKSINIQSRISENEDGSTIIYSTYTDVSQITKVDHMLDIALSNTGVSIWEYDFKRKCIIQYQNSTQMHGFETIVPDVPRSLVECGFVHPSSAKAFYEMYEKLFDGEPFAEGIFRVQNSDRSGYWYEHIRYTNSFDQDGKPYRAIGISTDETRQQEAISKYNIELEKERGLIKEDNLIAHALFDLTLKTTIEYKFRDGTSVPKNDRTAFSFGKENAHLIIDEDERKHYLLLNDPQELLSRFAKGENEFRIEYRRLLPSGTAIWIRNTMRLLVEPNTAHILLFEYWFDIEEEKMQELTYLSIARDNYDFITRIDGRTKRFTTISKEDLAFHIPPTSGDDSDKATYSLINDAVEEEDRETTLNNCLIDNIKDHLKTKDRFVFTYRLRRPDNSLRYKKITQYYLDAKREIIALMREDITELMEQENEKKRLLSQALETAKEANQAKSQFLSRVSHELRTPLNAILGFLDLSKGADINQIHTYLSSSEAAAHQLLSVINDVLDMSSIEAGKMKISNASFSFIKLINNINDIYMPQCQMKGLKFKTRILTPIKEWLSGDQLRVNQILLNLLNNAFKFTESGHIWFSISQEQTSEDKVMVHFEISDTGCGMSVEMQKRLFNPFEQESVGNARKYGGTGLGLSIVKNILTLMDGEIRVKSELSKGSVFSVDIPFTLSQPETQATKLSKVEDIRVLVIDDMETDRQYMSSVLSRLSISHSCVSNGSSAFEELNHCRNDNPYNICIIDWKMPGDSGLTIAGHIREQFGNDMMIIIVSAYDHYHCEESVKAAGGDLFIAKPVFQSKLFDILSNMTQGRITEKGFETNYDLSSMHILLAEDNAINRLMMTNILQRKFNTTCSYALDGEEALSMFLSSEKGAYDAILMDIQMPKMDGYEAAKRIRESDHPDAKTIQIIAVTADAFSEDVKKALGSGMNGHISKPIDLKDLSKALGKAYFYSKKTPAPLIAKKD